MSDGSEIPINLSVLEGPFRLEHKYGWTFKGAESRLNHCVVTNPQDYVAGCLAKVVGIDPNLDGSYDIHMNICK